MASREERAAPRGRGPNLFIFAHIDAGAVRAEYEAATRADVVAEFWGVSTRAYLPILDAYGGWSRYVERLAALYEVPAFEHTALACWSAGGELGQDVLLDAYRIDNGNVLPDALVLLDAIYGSKPSGSVMGDGQVVWSAHLEAIARYALEAAEGSRICILFHAARATPYASSRECIRAIVAHVETELGHALLHDESATAAELEARGFTRALALGNLHILGFPGDDPDGHVAEADLFDRTWHRWIPWTDRAHASADEPPPTQKPLPRLMLGSEGPFVSAWQAKLRDLGWPLEVDGLFGTPTSNATIELQRRNGLLADGVVTPTTRAAAERHPPLARSDGPGPPLFPVMSDIEREALFGPLRHLAAPTPDDPERIVIVGTWVAEHIAHVYVPQLRGIAGAPASCRVPFHKLVAPQLVALWGAWEDAGLLPLVLSWGGAWAPRFARGRPGMLARHVEGLAFDVNAPWNPLGPGRAAPAGTVGSVVPLVALARAHGFFWGNDYRDRPEPMRFEIARLVCVG